MNKYSIKSTLIYINKIYIKQIIPTKEIESIIILIPNNKHLRLNSYTDYIHTGRIVDPNTYYHGGDIQIVELSSEHIPQILDNFNLSLVNHIILIANSVSS